jgi:SAM-dependent methyltransferase
LPDVTRTIDDFGEQWNAFHDNPGYYGSADLLGDIFGPLLSPDDVNGCSVADIGSGTGRIVNMLLDAGAAHVYAVEPSAAMAILKDNTAQRRDRISYLEGPGEILPAGLDLDLVVSIGVLHHIPDPRPVVEAAYRALRPNGLCLVWLYAREGNEPYLAVVEPLRKVTVRLPHRALVGLAALLGLILNGYIALCRFLPLPMRTYMREVLAKFTPDVRRLTIYDQLNPTYAKYYTKEEADSLLTSCGFVDVQLYYRHGYSWTVLGRRLALNERLVRIGR